MAKVTPIDIRILKVCRVHTAQTRITLARKLDAPNDKWMIYRIDKLKRMGLIMDVGCGYYKLTKDGRMYVM